MINLTSLKYNQKGAFFLSLILYFCNGLTVPSIIWYAEKRKKQMLRVEEDRMLSEIWLFEELRWRFTLMNIS